MKGIERYMIFYLAGIFLPVFYCSGIASAQENEHQISAYEDYADEAVTPDDDYLATMEEWQNMVEQWLEKPLCINNEEADWLMDYKIISLYQLNKLKEYRLIFGNLLSVYELAFIDGWDFQTVRKVMPLVTVVSLKDPRTFKKFTFRSIHQTLVLKTAFSTHQSKGYKPVHNDEDIPGSPYYTGSPVRLALRYDLEYRNNLALGIRMEKDPGEPLLISSGTWFKKIKTPDLFSGYLLIKKIGPIQSLILGNYRVNFGYGVNLSGGQSGIRGRNGMAGMAHRIRPQTSVSETGFFRGAALQAGTGQFSMSGFISFQNIDGTSLTTDSLTGKPISFSSIDLSGLHRTESEISNRKAILEKVFGGYLVFRNNWLKTGLIALYNQFDASVAKSSRTYAKFGLSSRENFVTGLSATIWLPRLQIFTEASVSRNKGTAMLSGLQLSPVPGSQIMILYRNFGIDYQNWYGSGFISSGQNSNEKGIQASIRIELPKKWLLEMMADISKSQWVTYDLAAPSARQELKVMAEKAWPQGRSLIFSLRYLSEKVNLAENSMWISHPGHLSHYRLRLEGRTEAMTGIRLKSRIECNLAKGLHPGLLIFQDIEFATERLRTKFWLRTCFFDIPDYTNRIYAYENDVQYDFTSFMHYGKGVRGIIMTRFSPVKWMDLWFRLSTIYYTNKNIGSGWDEIESNRQNEIEIQVRIKVPG